MPAFASRCLSAREPILAIDAFEAISKSFSNVKMHIYGNGPEEERLKRYVNKKLLEDKIIFEGYAADVMERISDAEIFLLTSDYEGMPNALMEAMGIGLPVISTDCPCGGPKYLIKSGFNGLLVPVQDCEALCKALKFYLENPNIAQTYGINAKDICDKMNPTKIAKKWLDYCKNVIGKEE